MGDVKAITSGTPRVETVCWTQARQISSQRNECSTRFLRNRLQSLTSVSSAFRGGQLCLDDSLGFFFYFPWHLTS
jgi:hypothetical protein